MLNPQNRVKEALIDKQIAENAIPAATFNRMYGNLSDNSPLRKLFGDMSAWAAWIIGSRSRRQRICAPRSMYLFDLAVVQCLLRQGKTPKITNFKLVRETWYVKAPTAPSKEEA